MMVGLGDSVCWVRKRSRHTWSHFGSVPATVADHRCSQAALAVLDFHQGRPAALEGSWTFTELAGASLDLVDATAIARRYFTQDI